MALLHNHNTTTVIMHQLSQLTTKSKKKSTAIKMPITPRLKKKRLFLIVRAWWKRARRLSTRSWTKSPLIKSIFLPSTSLEFLGQGLLEKCFLLGSYPTISCMPWRLSRRKISSYKNSSSTPLSKLISLSKPIISSSSISILLSKLPITSILL